MHTRAGLAQRKERGLRLLKFASCNDLMLTNMFADTKHTENGHDITQMEKTTTKLNTSPQEGEINSCGESPSRTDPARRRRCDKRSTPKKGNIQLPHRLISHPSKVMLNIALNRLKTQAEKIIAEEQASLDQDAVQQNRSSISGYYARDTCNTNKSFTTSLWISRRHSVEYGTQLSGRPR